MAKDRSRDDIYSGPLRRLLGGLLVVALLGLFLLWRIDSPRVEKLRAQITDTFVPGFDWAIGPMTGAVNLMRDVQSYQRVVAQNQELRRELQQMKAWREAALQLEQENARLLDLNKVRLGPRLTHVTGVVLADTGSPFRQSVLLNVGLRDGIIDGWATMDGIGLVGRISGVGESSSRVLLLTDSASRIPAVIQPSGQRAIVQGDNSGAPLISFVENRDVVRPGDRVISAGDGGVFPGGLLIGQVAQDPGGRLRVRLAADTERLAFLRVLRNPGIEVIDDPGALIVPLDPGQEPRADDPAADPGADAAARAEDD